MWLRVGAVQSERNVGKRKTTALKTPHGNRTLQSNMAYSDAFTMKLPVITPTRLLLCNSICYFDGISLPPPTQNIRPTAGFFLALNIAFVVKFYSRSPDFLLLALE